MEPSTKKSPSPWVKGAGWGGDEKDPRERLIKIFVILEKKLPKWCTFADLINNTYIAHNNSPAFPDHIYANDRRQKARRSKKKGRLTALFDPNLKSYFHCNKWINLLYTMSNNTDTDDEYASVAGTNNPEDYVEEDDDVRDITKKMNHMPAPSSDTAALGSGYIHDGQIHGLQFGTSANAIAGTWGVSWGPSNKPSDDGFTSHSSLNLLYEISDPGDVPKHSLKFVKDKKLSSDPGYTVMKHTCPAVPTSRFTDRQAICNGFADDEAERNRGNPTWGWESDGVDDDGNEKYKSDIDAATRVGRDTGIQDALQSELKPQLEGEEDEERQIDMKSGLLGMPLHPVTGEQLCSLNKNWQTPRWNITPTDDTLIRLTHQSAWDIWENDGEQYEVLRHYVMAEVQVEVGTSKNLKQKAKEGPRSQKKKLAKQRAAAARRRARGLGGGGGGGTA